MPTVSRVSSVNASVEVGLNPSTFRPPPAFHHLNHIASSVTAVPLIRRHNQPVEKTQQECTTSPATQGQADTWILWLALHIAHYRLACALFGLLESAAGKLGFVSDAPTNTKRAGDIEDLEDNHPEPLLEDLLKASEDRGTV